MVRCDYVKYGGGEHFWLRHEGQHEEVSIVICCGNGLVAPGRGRPSATPRVMSDDMRSRLGIILGCIDTFIQVDVQLVVLSRSETTQT